MMDNLRTMASHTVLKIILVLIIISFIFTGVGSYMYNQSSDVAVKVNGEAIPMSVVEYELANAKRRLVEKLGQRSADEIFRDATESDLLRQQAVKQAVNRELFSQYVRSIQLGASTEQIKEFIRAIPAFTDDRTGQFNNQLYKNYLINSETSSDQFAEMVRINIADGQFSDIYQQSEFVLDNELNDYTALKYQQREIRLATIDVKALQSEQTVTEDEVDAYYQKNSEDFMLPEKIKVAYLPIDAVKTQEATPIDEQEIESYYIQHKSDYRARNYSFSQIKVATKEDADKLFTELQQGANFTDKVKNQSIDKESVQSDGQLPIVNQYHLSPAMQQANLMRDGQLSSPIEQQDGWIILRLNSIQLGDTAPLEDVQSSIKRAIQQERAQAAYQTLQDAASEAAKQEPHSLKRAEEVVQASAIATDWFTAETIPDDLNLPELKTLLFDGSLLAAEPSQAINSPLLQVSSDRAYIIRMIDYQAATKIPLADVRAKIIDTLSHGKALEHAYSEAEKALTALNTGANEEDALANLTLHFSAPEKVTRENAPAPEIFRLVKTEADKPVYTVAIDKKGNVILIALDKLINGTVSKEHKEADKMAWITTQSAANEEALLINLRSQAKIEDKM